MLKVLVLLFHLCFALSLCAQQSLDSRVAVYSTDGERFIVDSVQLSDSFLVLFVGDLSFEIAEERFARLERIPGGTFSKPDQIYSFSLVSGETIVGQVSSYKWGQIHIRKSDGTEEIISRDELQGLNIEKRNSYEIPWVKKCASANFISSPYALKLKEVVFSSFILGNSIEVGLGNGFAVKGLTGIVPIAMPTGYELLYKHRIENSNFSIGMTVGQIWLGQNSFLVETETINSSRNLITYVSPSFTYHMRNSYLKTVVSVLGGTSKFSQDRSYSVTSTYSAAGFKKPYNRWNFTLKLSPARLESNSMLDNVLLVGYQTHEPKGSATIGLGLTKTPLSWVVPFPYAYFSIYGSKEQKKISKAFNVQRRLRFLRRYLIMRNAKLANDRKRQEARESRRQSRQNL